MKLHPRTDGSLRLQLDRDEASMLDQLFTQLLQLLESHSGTDLDPDPLFASLEVGGSDHRPEDPALARLFPDAYEQDEDADQFRHLTEQGLVNRKLQDAMGAMQTLGYDGANMQRGEQLEVLLTRENLPELVRSLTALRLAIAARLGLESSDDHDRLAVLEETRGTMVVYDWLGAILESVLGVMNAPVGKSEAR